jgi:hypothetical protein
MVNCGTLCGITHAHCCSLACLAAQYASADSAVLLFANRNKAQKDHS